MVQTIIEFLIRNNITIIQLGFAIIFFLAIYVILKSFKEEKAAPVPAGRVTPKIQKKEESKETQPVKSQAPAMDDSPLDDLDNLDDLMGAVDDKPTTAQAPAQSTVESPATPQTPPQAAAPNVGQSAELQEALKEKEKVIGDLRGELTQLQEKLKTQVDTKPLEDKIKDLTEKLSEYEIIEDDIANLSFYKSENTKLKNELEKLKGVSSSLDTPPVVAPTETPAPAAAAEPPPATPSAPQPAKDDAVLQEFEKAVQQKEAIEKSMPEPAATKISVPKDDDLMKEFESMVEKEFADKKDAAPAAANPTPPPQAAEPVPAQNTQQPAAETKSKEPTADIDSQKLVQEMEAMSKSAPPQEPADDGKDSSQKLIEEFENFMNKASS